MVRDECGSGWGRDEGGELVKEGEGGGGVYARRGRVGLGVGVRRI